MACPVPSSTRVSDLNNAGLVTITPSSSTRAEWQRSHLCVAPLELPPAQLQRERTPCPHCGGSGMLRINVQSHRTCLECLGGGQRLLTSADLLRRAGLRAVVSSSAAG